MTRDENLLAEEGHNGCRLAIDESASRSASAAVVNDAAHSLEKPFCRTSAIVLDEG